ncbi:MAG: Ig-like domain-containing protein [Limnochordia bacterium]|nr:Ig-like domain-containing protein [Limnochordia bacterium]
MKNRWTYTLIIITALLGLTLTPAASGAERVVVLDFLALDSQGSYIDPLSFTQGDLVGLSKIMSQGIAARLVQFGEFDVQDSVSLREELADLGFAPDTPAWDRARAILTAGLADQVITGSLTLLQNTAVVGVQRFQLAGAEPVLVGSALASAARIQDAPNLVDSLLTDLFPPQVQVIERAVEQVFVVPGQVRLNLGQSKELTVYALDSLGRPVSSPEFLFLSSDESKVAVDERGVVTGLQPGTATITVRAITKGTRSGSPAVMQVTVLPPTFGVRVGSVLLPRGETRFPVRIGLRLTPTIDQKGSQTSAPDLTPKHAMPSDSSNPLGIISSFFGSMLTNGLMTIDLDFDPSRELLVSFSGVQRSSGGYLGAGVGYVTPLDNVESQKGFILRFTVGTQYRATNRLAVPVEAVMDAVFPTTSVFSPSFRLGINIGFDLFP